MATKAQKEYRKQMKQLKKEGKLPDGYYARRQRQFTGGGVSALVVLFILWRFGIFGMIFGGIMNLIMLVQYGGGNPPVMNEFYDYAASEINTEVNGYWTDTEGVETLIDDVYLDAYKQVYENKPMSAETVSSYQEKIETAYVTIETDNRRFDDMKENYKQSLAVASDLLDFAGAHSGQEATKQEKAYFDTLAKKYNSLSDKRTGIWSDLYAPARE